MDEDTLLKIFQDSRFIPNIFHYCDCWCEKCHFKSRCLSYVMEKKFRDDPSILELIGKILDKKLPLLFEQSKEIMNQIAAKRGVNVSDAEIESMIEKEEIQIENAQNNELSKLADQYNVMISQWFKSVQSLFAQKFYEFNTKLELEIDDENLLNEVNDIKDAIDTILWYNNQIYEKLVKALIHYNFDKDFNELYKIDANEEENESQKRFNGFAKVSLIGIDKSIDAWKKLREHFPEETNEILDILLHLDRLRQGIEQTFPNARSFIRPGFDTQNSTSI